MSEQLNSEEEDLLQSALSTAFSPAPLPRQSAAPGPATAPSSQPPSAANTVPHNSAEPVTSTGEPESTEIVWQEEYEAHVAEWRRRSAEQRQRAEETRAEWEARRKKEREEGKERSATHSTSTSEWESVGGSMVSASVAGPSPGLADVLVSSEGPGGHSKEYLESVLPGALGPGPTSMSTSTPPEREETPPSHPGSEPESSKQDKWDSMASSLTSSFPSMSFPSDPHSPVSSGARRDLAPPHASEHAPGHGQHHRHSHSQHHLNDEPARTATLSVFDSSLSPKTRALALLSSLAINVLLPFVNGVMLGFGEIFAKNVVVGWLGWKLPSTASAASSRGSGRVASRLGLGRK